jgi:hypothetical protein
MSMTELVVLWQCVRIAENKTGPDPSSPGPGPAPAQSLTQEASNEVA